MCGQPFWLHDSGCHGGRRDVERRRKGLPVTEDDLITLTQMGTKAVSVEAALSGPWSNPVLQGLPADISVTGTAPLRTHVYDVIEDFMLQL